MWASSLKHFPVYVAERVDACGLCCPGSLASQFSVTFCPIEADGGGGREGRRWTIPPTFESAPGVGWGGAGHWRLVCFLCAPPSQVPAGTKQPGILGPAHPSASPGPSTHGWWQFPTMADLWVDSSFPALASQLPYKQPREPAPCFKYIYLKYPWTARRSNQSINPEYSLEGRILKLKLQYFGHLM